MLLFVLLSILGTLLLIQYLKLLWTTRYTRNISPCLPNSLYPLLGHLPMLYGIDSTGIFNAMEKAFREVDRLSRLMIGPLPLVLVNHPETMEALLTNEHLLGKPYFYDFMEVSDGIFGMRDAERWSNVRRILNRTFTPTILKSFLPIMDSKATMLVEKLRSMVSNGTQSDAGIDILPHFGDCNLDIIFNTTMGCNENEVSGKSKYFHSLEIVVKIVSERMLNIFQYLDVMFQMTETYRRKNANRAFIDQFSEKIIHTRKQQLEKEQLQAAEEDEFRTRSMIFLDQLLTIREGEKAVNFTDEEIMAQLLTMMVAGSDTTANAMSTCCLFLAMHPEIQNKVVAEMNAVFTSDSVEINQDTLQQLRYTEQVINETLRLAPVGVLMARETSAEVVLGGVRIPPKQVIVYNLHSYHRRQDVWGPNADQFDPDRFEPEQVEKRHRFAFVPFLAGQRNCIGKRYAMFSMKIVLLRVLQEFRLWTDLKQLDMRFKFEITLRLVGPYRVWLSRRNK